MKQLLLICAVVALVGCANDTRKAALVPPADEKLIADPILEKAVREKLEKPEGKLTKADLEKVTILYLRDNKLT